MAQATPRTHFHSSRLIRVLADLALLETAAPGAAFAERLGLWVDYTDAITLCAAHSNGPSPQAPQTAQAPAAASTVARKGVAAPALAQAFAQTRAALEAGLCRATAAVAPGADYEAWRRHYTAQQREMEARIGPLRVQLRDALAQSTPALQQLAALDAAFDGILAEREARLLATLALLLNKRFNHLRRQQEALDNVDRSQGLAQTNGAPPAPAPPATDWQTGFGRELQTVLLAELDLRLQPALGLLEAFENEKTNKP